MADAPDESVTVVLNPTKINDRDRFRAEVARVVETRSGTTGVPIEVAWTQTTVDDPGAGQTRRAVEQGASLVIAVGGDGTVTACAGVLAGTGVALGVVPVGTGNLLARNLGIPLQRESALATAFDDHVRSIDVLASGERRFVVMAEMGLDAAMIRNTDNDLKATLGWLGYLEGVRRAIVGAKGARYTVIVDDSDTAIRQKAVGVVVANVGKLVGGLTLTSTAVPDDGRFDVVILAPHRADRALAHHDRARRPSTPARGPERPRDPGAQRENSQRPTNAGRVRRRVRRSDRRTLDHGPSGFAEPQMPSQQARPHPPLHRHIEHLTSPAPRTC